MTKVIEVTPSIFKYFSRHVGFVVCSWAIIEEAAGIILKNSKFTDLCIVDKRPVLSTTIFNQNFISQIVILMISILTIWRFNYYFFHCFKNFLFHTLQILSSASWNSTLLTPPAEQYIGILIILSFSWIWGAKGMPLSIMGLHNAPQLLQTTVLCRHYGINEL